MAQLRLGHPEIKRRGAEIFHVTLTPPALGPLYARRFTLPFPYLCDGDLAVYRRYGLTTKGALAALRTGLESFPRIVTGIVKGEQPSLLPYSSTEKMTTEQAIFLVAQDGRVSFRYIADGHAPVPPNETLLRAVDALSSGFPIAGSKQSEI